MLAPFVYTANAARVIFGSGTVASLPEEAARLGLSRLLVLATPQQEEQAQSIAALLRGHSVGVLASAVMHTPVDVTDRAMERVSELQADGIVSIGGGSTIGLGKAIAFRTDLPQIVIPTTYAGSEMTPVLGETRDGAKFTRSDPRILPEAVIYDVDLTLTLPSTLSGTSGINAIAHAVEALYARETNPIVELMALEAIRALTGALPQIAADPGDRQARAGALYGAWLCGTCLGVAGMALHHKLCHTLGGTFGLPHAETHTIVLPHALAYNGPAVPAAIRSLASVLGSDPPTALYDLAGAVGAPRALRELGMPEGGIDEAADRALANPYWNPRRLEREAVRALIASAWAGTPPQKSSDMDSYRR